MYDRGRKTALSSRGGRDQKLSHALTCMRLHYYKNSPPISKSWICAWVEKNTQCKCSQTTLCRHVLNTGTSIWTVFLVLSSYIFSKFNRLNTDTQLMQTLSTAPLVSVLKGASLYIVETFCLLFTIFSVSNIVHLDCHEQFCMTFAFNFSWVLQWSSVLTRPWHCDIATLFLGNVALLLA